MHLAVRDGDAAIGPIDCLLDGAHSSAHAVNADVATKRGVLRRETVVAERIDDRFEACVPNSSFEVGARRDGRSGIVQTEKDVEGATAIYPGDPKSTKWSAVVPLQVNFSRATSADRYVAKARNDTIARRNDTKGKRMGINQDPGHVRGEAKPRYAACDSEEVGYTPVPPSRSVTSHQCAGRWSARALKFAGLAVVAMLASVGVRARAGTFALPRDGATVVGHIQVIRLINARNTLFDIARHYDLGYNEITAANPSLSLWLPGAGTRVVVPTEFILPPKPWVGIVIDVARRRLYYFPKPKRGMPAQVVTFPVGISVPGWATPLGQTKIIAKYKNPSWIVPKNIQEEHKLEGQPRFPKYFPPGPDNPMGMLAMETGFSEIFIHGTSRPWGVGMRVSHGCLHLYPENAAYLFPRLPIGTPVRIVDQPFLVGERGGVLYMSASKSLPEYPVKESFLTRAVAAVVRYQASHPAIDPPVQWKRMLKVAQARGVVPTPISAGAAKLSQEIAEIPPTDYRFSPYGIDGNDGAPPQGGS